MTTRRTVKAVRPKLVAVIASRADLNMATTLKEPPDLFEIRLDSLFPITNQVAKKFARLSAPLIITARDPREGGIGNLSFAKRRELLLQFLPSAKYIDVELRSARAFRALLAQAKKQNVRRILSYHNFKATPSRRSLCAKAKQAKALGVDILKIATLTDSAASLSRLVDFITTKSVNVPVSAMGMGKLGGISRLLLARCGSVLNYAATTQANVEGQLSIDVFRSSVGALPLTLTKQVRQLYSGMRLGKPGTRD